MDTTTRKQLDSFCKWIIGSLGFARITSSVCTRDNYILVRDDIAIMFAWDFRDGFVCDLFEYKFLPSSDEYGKDVFFLPLDELAGLIPGTRESENAVEAVELAKAWLSENLASNAKSKDIFKGRRRRRMTVYFDETH